MKLKFTSWRLLRIVGVGYGLFIGLFSLDVFGMEGGILVKMGGWLMHMIPSFLVWVLVFKSKKYPVLASWGFLGLGVVSTLFFHTYEDVVVFLLISGPLLGLGLVGLNTTKRA